MLVISLPFTVGYAWLPSKQGSENYLTSVEGFGITFWCVAADASQPRQGKKGVVAEPGARVLASEVLANEFDFAAYLSAGHGYEKAGIGEVAVIFRNLVFEDEMVSKCVVSEIANEPMVLMRVVLPMGEHQRRLEFTFQLLEKIFDLGTVKGEIAIAKIQNINAACCSPLQKDGGGTLRFCPSQLTSAEYHPSYGEIGYLVRKTQNRCAAADLDIVRMRAQAQKIEGTLSKVGE